MTILLFILCFIITCICGIRLWLLKFECIYISDYNPYVLSLLSFIKEELVNFCNKNNIPIYYSPSTELYDKDKNTIAAGTFYFYYCDQIKKDIVPVKIILNESVDSNSLIFVLAHEIGHYIAIQYKKDTSEEAANREGKILINSFLSFSEQYILSNYVSPYSPLQKIEWNTLVPEKRISIIKSYYKEYSPYKIYKNTTKLLTTKA